MRIILLSILLMVQLSCLAQDTLPKNDSAGLASITKKSAQPYKQNFDYFLEVQRKNRAKQKQQALLYMGMGVVFFAVLVVSVVRRRRARKL